MKYIWIIAEKTTSGGRDSIAELRVGSYDCYNCNDVYPCFETEQDANKFIACQEYSSLLISKRLELINWSEHKPRPRREYKPSEANKIASTSDVCNAALSDLKSLCNVP